eukprot:5474766-Prymnesium_polylepis.3
MPLSVFGARRPKVPMAHDRNSHRCLWACQMARSVSPEYVKPRSGDCSSGAGRGPVRAARAVRTWSSPSA